MNCSICSGKSESVFKALLLNKYTIHYYQCNSCKFIQTESPFWLQEAYGSAITSLDLGLVKRNLELSTLTEFIIKKCFNFHSSFLDYAGGYGLFVRLMRDKGLDFYWTDQYCENLFAKDQDIKSNTSLSKFELVTAFEVFEHLVDPLEEIKRIFSFSDSILFSTELQPPKGLKKAEDWWYFMPEIGQHVSLFSEESLKVIAEKFNCYLFSNKTSIHLLTPKKLKEDPFKVYGKKSFLERGLEKALGLVSGNNSKIELKSLLEGDYMKAKEKLRK